MTRLLALLLLLAPLTGLAGEAGSVLKPDSVRAEPYRDARSVAPLARGDSVEILTRQGGWYRVRSQGKEGWVPMLSIRRGGASAVGGSSGSLLGLASGRAGTGKIVATTGVRGLSEEQLQASRYDAAQLRRLDSYATGRQQAAQHAAAAGLAAHAVEPLPTPAQSGGEQP